MRRACSKEAAAIATTVADFHDSASDRPVETPAQGARCDAHAQLQEILPPQLDGAARVSGRTRAAGVRQMEGAGPRKVRLREDMDNL